MDWINDDGSLKPGVYTDMSDAQYQALPALRWSTLKAGLTSPRHLLHALNETRPDTPALRLGRLYHVALLQPETLRDVVVIVPDEFVTRTGISSGAKARAWLAEHTTADHVVASDAELAAISVIADDIYEHAPSRSLMNQCPGREVTCIWIEDTVAGPVACKARADMIGPDTLADLKTWSPRSGLTARAWGSEVWHRAYHAQMGFYSRGFRQFGYSCRDWSWLVVDKRTPTDLAVWTLDGTGMEVGDAMAREALEVYATATRDGHWPGAQPEAGEVSLPRYVFDSMDDLSDLGLEGFGDE